MLRLRILVICVLGVCAAVGLAQEPLPAGAIKRLGSARLRTGSRILCVRFSPDGRFLASGGGNDPVRIWDASTGEQVKELKDAWVNALIFSSRGTRLITADSFKAVREWDLANTTEVAQLKGHESAVTCMAISSDNTLLATADQTGAIILWELFLSPKQLQRCTGHTGEITALAMSPDGRTLASASNDRSIRIWNAADGTSQRVLDGGCCVAALVFLANGALASAGDDNQIRIWDLNAGKQVGAWSGHEDTVTALLLTPDGKTVISGARDKTIRLWNVADGKQTGAIERDLGDSDALTLSPDGKVLVAAGINNTMRRWDMETRKELDAGGGHRSPVSQVALAPDGKMLVSSGLAGDIRTWDPIKGVPVRNWQNPAAGDVLLAYSPDGKLLASATERDGVRLWNLSNPDQPQHLPPVAGDSILSLTFAPDAKTLAVGHRSGAIRLWDVAQAKSTSELKYSGPVNALAYSQDGNTLAASGGKDVALWDAAGKPLRQFGPKETVLLPAVSCLAFSPDGKMLATGSFDSNIRLWDTETGALIRAVEGHTSAVQSIAFSVDGRRIASGGYDGTVRLWEAHGGRQVAMWRGHRGPVSSVALALDGRSILSGGADTTILHWDVTGKSATGQLPPRKLMPPELQAGWQALASQNANEANPIIWDMVASPAESLPFLDKSIFLLDHAKLTNLIRDLDSPMYLVREKASIELANFGRWIEPALETRAKEPGSEEMRRRIGRLLEKLRETGALTPEQEVLRFRRAMLVLEQDGSEPAQNLLRKITTNGPEAYLQAEARASLARLKNRQ